MVSSLTSKLQESEKDKSVSEKSSKGTCCKFMWLYIYTLHICHDILHYICLAVSNINVTDDHVITEQDVEETFSHHVQSVPSTSEGKFNIASLHFSPLIKVLENYF